ncbi:MAG: hypothetical protein GEV07_02640 [Streptosporangiales bacterium]|nr:hypothetical protein [Streptosporangiales bacterium]
MAEYLILTYENEDAWADADDETRTAFDREHATFGATHAGALRGGNALHPTAMATTLRNDAAAGRTITDGPFAEARAALGGYYLVEAADLDQAIAVAKDVPTRFGGVEVRPVRPTD